MTAHDPASRTPGEIAWYDEDARARCDGPAEWKRAWGALGVAVGDMGRLRVFKSGEPLAVCARSVDGVVRVGFEWPRADPGRHRLTVDDGATLGHADVWVRPSKLDDANIDRMMEDLTLGLPAEIALSVADAGALTGLNVSRARPVTVGGEIERLRRAVHGTPHRPGLAAVIEQIARDPHSVLVPEEHWTPAARVRRPVPSRVTAAYVAAGNLDGSGHPRKLVDARTRAALDVYENRVVRAWIDRVDAGLRRLASVVPARGAAALAVADLGRLVNVARRRGAFLAEVSSLRAPPTTVTMVLARRRDYRAALDGLLDLTRTATVDLRAPGLDARIENLPSLYQMWATLKVVTAALGAARARGWALASQRIARAIAGEAVVELIADNRPVLEFSHADGARVRVTPERAYGLDGPLRAVTFAQRPDVAVERTEPCGARTVWILDPKYKLAGDLDGSGRPVKEDVDKMHAYRDAIRDDRGGAVVRFAGVLYPGETERWSPGIAAICARPDRMDVLDRALESLFADVFARA